MLPYFTFNLWIWGWALKLPNPLWNLALAGHCWLKTGCHIPAPDKGPNRFRPRGSQKQVHRVSNLTTGRHLIKGRRLLRRPLSQDAAGLTPFVARPTAGLVTRCHLNPHGVTLCHQRPPESLPQRVYHPYGEAPLTHTDHNRPLKQRGLLQTRAGETPHQREHPFGPTAKWVPPAPSQPTKVQAPPQSEERQPPTGRPRFPSFFWGAPTRQHYETRTTPAHQETRPQTPQSRTQEITTRRPTPS